MQNIEAVIDGKRLGIISSHPDDHLVHGHAIHTAAEKGLTIHEITLTLGRLSTINFLAPDDAGYVANGGRQHEGELAAKVLGIMSNTHLDFPDGQLHLSHNRNKIVAAIREWVIRHEIGILLTLGTLADHTDHQASALAARLAAQALSTNDSTAIGLLELEAAGQGTVVAGASRQSVHTTYRAAAAHPSQFQVSTEAQPGWQPTATGLWLHPHTAQGLAAYPIGRAATYLFTPPTALTPH